MFFCTTRFGNVETRFVPRPEMVASYSRDANTVDVENHNRQGSLGLERKWVTQDGNFCMATGFMGMTTDDVHRLSQHSGIADRGRKEKIWYLFLLSWTNIQ